MTKRGDRVVLHITLARLAASPIFVLLFCLAVNDPHDVTKNVDILLMALALGVLLLQELADGIASMVVRESDVELRPILDPLADSLTHFSAFLCLLWVGLVPVWLPVAMAYRDGLVSVLRVIAAKRGAIIGARLTSNLKATLHGGAAVVLICCLLIASSDIALPLRGISDVFAWLLILVNVASLADYYLAFRRALSQ